jgi:hypothetical protein
MVGRMFNHDITEFYEVLNVYGTLISIYHCQGKVSIVTREHQGGKVCYKTYKRVSTEDGGAQRKDPTSVICRIQIQ